MGTDDALSTVTELRTAAFDLLEAATDQSAAGGPVAAAIDHLQVVANELGAVEELAALDDWPRPVCA